MLDSNTKLQRTWTASVRADTTLASMEATKVQIQSQSGYANTLRDTTPIMPKKQVKFSVGVLLLWLTQTSPPTGKLICSAHAAKGYSGGLDREGDGQNRGRGRQGNTERGQLTLGAT